LYDKVSRLQPGKPNLETAGYYLKTINGQSKYRVIAPL
jgi:hypothetical protein